MIGWTQDSYIFHVGPNHWRMNDIILSRDIPQKRRRHRESW